jgi:hypothetical protein
VLSRLVCCLYARRRRALAGGEISAFGASLPWGRDYDVLHLRTHVLRLIPVRTTVLVRKTIDDHARATRRQRGDRRAHDDGCGHANRYANRYRVDVPAIVVVVIVMMVMVIVIVVVIIVVAVVVMVAAAVVVVVATAAVVVVVAAVM